MHWPPSRASDRYTCSSSRCDDFNVNSKPLNSPITCRGTWLEFIKAGVSNQSDLRVRHILLVDGLDNRYRVNEIASGFDFGSEQHI
jgi:hypothetical protein